MNEALAKGKVGELVEKAVSLQAASDFKVAASRVSEEESWADNIGVEERKRLVDKAQVRLNEAEKYKASSIELLREASELAAKEGFQLPRQLSQLNNIAKVYTSQF